MGKKLAIIENKKESEFSTSLFMLISAKDDNAQTGEVLGIKDGSVDAVIWNERQYLDSKSKIQSNNKVLFVGLSDTSKAISKHIAFDPLWKQYGIYIGWLGNVGVIYTDPDVLSKNKEKYNEFYELYSQTFKAVENTPIQHNTTEKSISTTKKITNLLNNGIQKAGKGANSITNFGRQIKGKITKKDVEFKEFNSEKLPQITEKQAKFITGSVIAFPIGIFDKVFIATIVNLKDKAKNKKEIHDQLYSFTIFKFYLDYLSKFMELDD